MTTESQDNNKRVFRVAQGDSQTPESNWKQYEQLKALELDSLQVTEVQRLITAATLAAQKALLERFKQDAKETGNNLWDIDEIADILQRQQLRKKEHDMSNINPPTQPPIPDGELRKEINERIERLNVPNVIQNISIAKEDIWQLIQADRDRLYTALEATAEIFPDRGIGAIVPTQAIRLSRLDEVFNRNGANNE